MADRLAQVAGHLSGAHPRGLLAGEVAIVTGAFQRGRGHSPTRSGGEKPRRGASV